MFGVQSMLVNDLPNSFGLVGTGVASDFVAFEYVYAMMCSQQHYPIIYIYTFAITTKASLGKHHWGRFIFCQLCISRFDSKAESWVDCSKRCSQSCSDPSSNGKVQWSTEVINYDLPSNMDPCSEYCAVYACMLIWDSLECGWHVCILCIHINKVQ